MEIGPEGPLPDTDWVDVPVGARDAGEDAELAAWDVGPEGRIVFATAGKGAVPDGIEVILGWTATLGDRLPGGDGR